MCLLREVHTKYLTAGLETLSAGFVTLDARSSYPLNLVLSLRLYALIPADAAPSDCHPSLPCYFYDVWQEKRACCLPFNLFHLFVYQSFYLYPIRLLFVFHLFPTMLVVATLPPIPYQLPPVHFPPSRMTSPAPAFIHRAVRLHSLTLTTCSRVTVALG